MLHAQAHQMQQYQHYKEEGVLLHLIKVQQGNEEPHFTLNFYPSQKIFFTCEGYFFELYYIFVGL